MDTRGSVSVAILASLLAAGCDQKLSESADAGKAANTSVRTVLGAGATVPISPGSCGGGQIGPEFVLTLNEDSTRKIIQNLSNNKEIFRSITRNGQTSPNPNISATKYWPTNIDIGIDLPAGSAGYNAIAIRVKPDGKNDVIFLRPKLTTDPSLDLDSSAAITVEFTQRGYFCGLKPITHEGDFEVVRFGTTLPPGEIASYNIGLLIRKAKGGGVQWTPIFIDPNVKNVG